MLGNSVKTHHILYIVSFLAIFSLFSATFASALTYQQEIGVNFTFNTALNLTISADLYINNLAPGAASDSNIIDVNVLTNAINGYTLTANVGNNTTYNTRNLVHSNTSLSNTFTSIAYSATPTITTNTNLSADTWGFSYSTNNGSTWSNYNGLPLYSDTTNVATLKETTGPVSSASGDDVKFKIAAKASASQVSGAYNNVINFNLAANVVPQYTVQFNAGDGSGTMPSQTIFRDEATMLAPNSFTPPSGFVFTGWNTAADGSGTSYTNQESVTNIAADGGSITLYAQWIVSVCAGHENELYCKVAAMNKGTQTPANLKAAITTPTSSNPATDTSNSGVYEYDASVFGVSSDASNDYPIYYYRGILDSNLDDTSSTYGSIGDGAYYPNYVRLGDTCWRIVRTTGSGGVKMIYNGLYSSGTTTNSCANATNDAQLTYTTFYGAYSGGQSTDYLFSPAVGYTFGSSTSSASIGANFGTNEDYAVNKTDSNVKSYLEGTWFSSANGISDYRSILEPSAGYCNDRTIYSSASSTNPLDDSVEVNTYENDGHLNSYYFGAYVRNYNNGHNLTLSCPRNIVDLYTTSSASDGNGQLNEPVALLTADEIALSGSGRGNYYSSNNNRNSFLNSNVRNWTLSPSHRGNGYTETFVIRDEGPLDVTYINVSSYVRPAISLKSGTTPSSGNGTATNPWVINEPPKRSISDASRMQEVEECSASLTTGQVYTLTDSRDGTSYNVAKLADGNCWMLDNLALDIANSSVQARMNRFNTNAARATLQRLFGVISPRDPNTNPNGQYPTAAVGYADNNNYYSIPKIAVSGLCSSDGCVDSPTSGEWNSNALLENDLTGISGRIGMYYNYCAISAGSYCYGNGTSDTGSPTSDPDPNSLQDIKEDICPKGWRLPTGGGNGEYLSLYNQYASASPNQETAFQSAFHIILSGSFISGHSSSQGGVNKLPTSTWASDSNVVLLWSDNRYDSMNYAENRSNGHSVRCIFNSQ